MQHPQRSSLSATTWQDNVTIEYFNQIVQQFLAVNGLFPRLDGLQEPRSCFLFVICAAFRHLFVQS